jgi:hypothetical protein
MTAVMPDAAARAYAAVTRRRRSLAEFRVGG